MSGKHQAASTEMEATSVFLKLSIFSGRGQSLLLPEAILPSKNK